MSTPIKLNWARVLSIPVSKFRIYRSILGFQTKNLPFTGLAIGQNLTLKVDDVTTTVTFTAIDINSVIASFSTIEGLTAYKAANEQSILVRHNLRQPPSTIEIVSGTALSGLGLTARVIEDKSEYTLLTEIAVTDPEQIEFTYEDADGVLQDWYYITAIDSLNNESDRTTAKQAISISGPICVIEGRLVTGDGQVMVDQEVKAKLALPVDSTQTEDDALIAPGWISTISNVDGSFGLPLLRNHFYYLVIDAVSYAHYVRVPDLPFVKVTDLEVVNDQRFDIIEDK